MLHLFDFGSWLLNPDVVTKDDMGPFPTLSLVTCNSVGMCNLISVGIDIFTFVNSHIRDDLKLYLQMFELDNQVPVLTFFLGKTISITLPISPFLILVSSSI